LYPISPYQSDATPSGGISSGQKITMGAMYWHAETLSLSCWHIVLSGGFACLVGVVKWVV